MAVGKGSLPLPFPPPAHTDHLEVEASCLAAVPGEQSHLKTEAFPLPSRGVGTKTPPPFLLQAAIPDIAIHIFTTVSA